MRYIDSKKKQAEQSANDSSAFAMGWNAAKRCHPHPDEQSADIPIVPCPSLIPDEMNDFEEGQWRDGFAAWTSGRYEDRGKGAKSKE